MEEHNVENGTCNIEGEEKLQNYAIFHDSEHKNFFSNVDKSTHITEHEQVDRDTRPSKQASIVKHVLYMLLASRINLILLAGIVNILLVLKLGDWFGQVILI